MESTNYDEYSKVLIETLFFVWGNSRNRAVYNRLKNNNIKTLKELFEKYDDESLVFPEFDKDANAQARAVIELIRFKYLRCDTLLDIHLNTIIQPFIVTRFEQKGLNTTIQKLRTVGLERRQAEALAEYICKHMKQPTVLGDLLIEYYDKNYRYIGIGANELEDLRTKLSLLTEYYKIKKKKHVIETSGYPPIKRHLDHVINDMNIKALEEELQDLELRRAKLDKRIEFVTNQIELLKEPEEKSFKL